jgi:hypothetical protein
MIILSNIEPTYQFVSPLETYFGFIVLGLMLTVGYLIVRRYGGRQDQRESVDLQDALREAELEAYRRKREREAESPLNADDPPAPLAPLDQDEELARARAGELLRNQETKRDEGKSL